MGLFGKRSFSSWLKNASDEELSEDYEKRRVAWLEKGEGDITPEMERINDEMIDRSNKKWKKDHPNGSNHHWSDKNRWEDD